MGVHQRLRSVLRRAIAVVGVGCPPPNKALQLTWHSAFQSESGSLVASTLGASATVGGLCHAAERPVR